MSGHAPAAAPQPESPARSHGAPASRPAAPAGPPARRLTRDDVLRLGQSASPWEFLPVAAAALRAAPADDAVRFLLAAALGRLGLRTLALDQVAVLGPQAAADPAVPQLRTALEGLPADELTPEQRRATLLGNLEALGPRAADLAPHAAAWADRVASAQAFRALDGNVVRRAAGSRDPWTWLHLADLRGGAGAFVAQNVAARPAPRPPVTIEGIDPPWVLAAVAAATPRDATGFQPRLLAIQADPHDALDGLSLADLREILASERLLVFAGHDAGARLGAWLRARLDQRLAGLLIPAAGTRTRCEPPVSAAIQGALAEQDRHAAALRARVFERDRARSPAAFAVRPGARPLRILIPTCRYTTFLQHAGRDLVEAFSRVGCHAELLIEPDDHAQMSSVAYLEALDRLDPDLVVLINYTRAQLPGVMAPNVPIVTWVQDMMPHLFTRESGAAQGPLDFIAGHCGEDLFTRYGYDRARAIGSPVVASESKFHPAPVAPELRERFACEIACVTHHSETVQAMHERLVRESAADPDAAGVLAELLPICRDVAARAHTLQVWPTLKGEVAGVLARRHRLAGNPDVEGAVFRNYAMPVTDRAFRHLALEWAAGIAERRGWRFRLYGKGWDRHPTLARFAAGLSGHGEPLRAAYQCAATNLHLCVSSLCHQRPMECALSGGLPIVRPTRDAITSLRGRAQRALAAAGVTPLRTDGDGKSLYAFTDTAEGMAFAALCQRLGMGPDAAGLMLSTSKIAALRRREAADPIETDPAWLFGDLAEVSFVDEPGLERLVKRAIEHPGWREDLSSGIAARVRERLTHAALARRILDAVGRRARAVAGGDG